MKKIIIFMALMLTMVLSVSGMTYHQSGNDFYDSDGLDCVVQTDSDCKTWSRWVTMEYRDDSSFFERLSGEGLTSRTTAGIYRWYLEYDLSNSYGNNAPNVTGVCYLNEYDNATTLKLFDYTGGANDTIVQTYLEVLMRDGDQFTCRFNTIYLNNTDAFASSRWYIRYWIPTYETETAEPDRRHIIQLEEEVTELEAQITGEYQSTQDYILEVLKAVVKINFKLWVYAYWLLLIGLVVGVFSLIVYILWWVYNRVRGLR